MRILQHDGRIRRPAQGDVVVSKQDPPADLLAGHAGQYGDFLIEIAVDELIGIPSDGQGVIGHFRSASYPNVELEIVSQRCCLRNMLTVGGYVNGEGSAGRPGHRRHPGSGCAGVSFKSRIDPSNQWVYIKCARFKSV